MKRESIKLFYQVYVIFHTNNSTLFHYIAYIHTWPCMGFFGGSMADSNYDKYCYESNINMQAFCIGNEGLTAKVECTDTVVDTIHPAINLVFDEEKLMPMNFDKKNEGNCQNYHLDYLENLAWSLGYSNYTVNVKKFSSSGCKFVALDTCGDMQTIMEGGMETADIEAPYDITFWGSLDGKHVFLI